MKNSPANQPNFKRKPQPEPQPACSNPTKITEYSNGKLVQKIVIGLYKYCKADILGEGFSSTVYKASRVDNPKDKYAIKVINLAQFKKDVSMSLLEMEIQIMLELNHPNVIKCYDVYKTSTNYYLVTEYCPHGDLKELIKFQQLIPEDRAISIMQQVIEGYRYLVSKNIIHRDMKPANIMRFGNVWKIGDFGFASYCKDEYVLEKIHVGTPLYLPPESLYCNKYSHKSDIFAMGIIFYEMLTGTTPWPSENEMELVKTMKDCEQLPVPDFIITEQVREFIRKACEIDFYSRMSRQELKKFSFDNVDMEKLIKMRQLKGISPSLRPVSIRKILFQSSATGKPIFCSQFAPTSRPRCEKSMKKSSILNSASTTASKFLQPINQHEQSNLLISTYRDNCLKLQYEMDLCQIIYELISNISSLNFRRKNEQNLLSAILLKYCAKNMRLLTTFDKNTLNLPKWVTFKKTERYNKLRVKFSKLAMQYETQCEKYEKQGAFKYLKHFEDQLKQLRSTNLFNHKFYCGLFNSLCGFAKSCILNHPSDFKSMEEKKGFWRVSTQLKNIMQIFRARADQETLKEMLGLQEKPASFINQSYLSEIYCEDSYSTSYAQLSALCEEVMK